MPIPPVSGITQIENHKYNKPRASREDPDRRHNGLDYYAPRGTQVKASASGIVAFVGKFEPRERLVNVKYNKKEKRFTGAYGNVIIIYHGQNIKTQKHTCTLYSHLVDNVAMRKGRRVKVDQLVGFVGNTGTRANFDKKDSGYKLHFEVIESKNEISTWPMRLETDYGIQNQIYRIDPEKFLTTSFKTVFVDELVKEALSKLKKETFDISKLVGKWVKFVTKSGYVGLTAVKPVAGPLGVKGGVYWNPSNKTAYVSLGIGLFTRTSTNVVYSRDALSTLSWGAYIGPLDLSEGFEGFPRPTTLEFDTSRKGAGIYFEITLPVPPGPTQPFNFHQFDRL